MQKLKRNINIGFRVNQQEQDLIRSRMSQCGFRNMRAYLLKMALNGYVINVDLTDVRECSRLLRIISNNLNQIAKRVNEGGSANLADIQFKLDEVREQQGHILNGITKVLREV
ncbi:MAG: plasmid mobilization relaxosome protein MobC [Dehalococcoidia bacterium]|nr:plasmid mobilization relaxosome protein MobC [Dehalococcoidia bacterium]